MTLKFFRKSMMIFDEKGPAPAVVAKMEGLKDVFDIYDPLLIHMFL